MVGIFAGELFERRPDHRTARPSIGVPAPAVVLRLSARLGVDPAHPDRLDLTRELVRDTVRRGVQVGEELFIGQAGLDVSGSPPVFLGGELGGTDDGPAVGLAPSVTLATKG